jgi:adenine-specific DNA-methyltransferase
MAPLQLCRAVLENRLIDPETREFFTALPAVERHYWIASLYALRMRKARRRKLAAYFTPPHLAQYAIDVLREAGIEPGKARILDPASGGAAFLVPLAAQIARSLRKRGAPAAQILTAVESTLAGVEIEDDLARLASDLVADVLKTELSQTGRHLKLQIQTADTLSLEPPKQLYDAVVGNPPYGRVFKPTKRTLQEFAPVITDGYVNLYSLFIDLSIRWVKPGGVVCLIVPVSFVGGPHFANLRRRILADAQVLRLDPIDKRSDVFLDVLYDICILVLRKRDGAEKPVRASSALLEINKEPQDLGYVDLPPVASDRIWALPDGTREPLFSAGFETLQDYGYIARAGYFVWNREQHRYRTGNVPRLTEVPLYWAHNIRPNALCRPHADRDEDRLGFVRVEEAKKAVITTDAVIVQRTSNRSQKRRLIAGLIRQSAVPGGRGFLTENHTILLLPDPDRKQTISLATLCKLLNSAAVDARFRRMSGSVSVSTKALRVLPLPKAACVREAFAGRSGDAAATLAYELTAMVAGGSGKEKRR